MSMADVQVGLHTATHSSSSNKILDTESCSSKSMDSINSHNSNNTS